MGVIILANVANVAKTLDTAFGQHSVNIVAVAINDNYDEYFK